MNMKLASIALSGALLISGAVFAEDCYPSFYLGGDLQANRYNGQSKTYKDRDGDTFRRLDGKTILSKNGSGVGLFAGVRFLENLGLEAGISKFAKQTTNLTNANTVFNFLLGNNFKDKVVAKHSNAYMDVMGYLPVSGEVDLIGSLGLGRLSSKQTVTSMITNAAGTILDQGAVTTKSSKTGVRLGVGAQVKFCDNIGARLLVNHQKGNKIVKSVNSVRAGLFYQF